MGGTPDLDLPERGRERTDRARRSPISVEGGGDVLMLCGFREWCGVGISTKRAPLLLHRAMCSDEEGSWCPFSLRWRVIICSVESAWHLVGATSKRSPGLKLQAEEEFPFLLRSRVSSAAGKSALFPASRRLPLAPRSGQMRAILHPDIASGSCAQWTSGEDRFPPGYGKPRAHVDADTRLQPPASMPTRGSTHTRQQPLSPGRS